MIEVQPLASITSLGSREWVVRVPVRDPLTGKAAAPHFKTIRGTKKDAEAYLAWFAGLIAAGDAPRQTVSQSELQDLDTLERKAAAYRETKAEPGALRL